MGSLVGVALFWPLQMAPPLVQVAVTAAVFVASVWAASRVAKKMAVEDPGVVVIDEVVGQWVTLLFLPFTPAVAAAGFLLFRVLDVFKPWPARQLESLPGGWGIMSDDLMAGIYGNLLLHAGLRALS